MNKLPVAKVVRDAYGFTFGHLGTVIGLIWAPLVIATLLNLLPEIAGNYGGGSASGETGAAASFTVWLLSLLLKAIIYVVVTRQALGLRKGPATFHIALGQPEFRVFGAVLLAVVMPLSAYFVCMVAGALAAMEGAAGSGAASVILFLGPAVFYMIVRLGFVVVPVTVSENKIDLLRGWVLTRGNFWRIVAVLVAIVAPIYLLETAGTFVLMGSDIAAVLPTNGGQDPQAAQKFVAALVDIYQRHGPALLGLDLILAPFGLGLVLSASAFAYRELAAPASAA